MRKPSIFARLGLVAGLAFLGSMAFAATATVDGIGGNPTADPTFPTSYATVGAALTAVKAAAGDHDIVITTAGPIDEPAGLLFNTAQAITVTGVAGGTHLRINGTGIGVAGTACAMAVAAQATTSVTLSNLLITPATGSAGPVAHRAIQFYAAAAGNVGTLTLNSVMVSALDVTNSNTPITNPFASPYSTRTARAANLRGFSGGTANGVIEVRNDNNAAPGLLTLNMTNSGVTHAFFTGAAAATASGLSINRVANFNLNINQGCFFTFCDSAGIRTVGTITTNWTATIAGTSTNPVVVAFNGWQEETANIGRSEGLAIDGPWNISHAIIINNHRIGIVKTGAGVLQLDDSLVAYNQFDLDSSNGSPPNLTTSANVRHQGTAALNISRSTLFDAQQSNGAAITWTSAVGSSISTNDVVVAGGSDQIRADNAGAPRTFSDVNSAFVEAGPVAMASPTFVLGTNVVRSSDGFAVTADPDFASTSVGLSWNGLGNPIGFNSDAFSVRSTDYRAARAVGAGDVKGWNQASPLPVELSTFMLD